MAASHLILKWQDQGVFKKWEVMKFLVSEGEKLSCIHEHLLKVYSETNADVRTVRWWVRNRRSRTSWQIMEWLPLHCSNAEQLRSCWWTDMWQLSHKERWTTCSTLSISRGSVIKLLKSLAIPRHVLIGCCEYLLQHIKRNGKQLPLTW
jgi:hypothetical protein